MADLHCFMAEISTIFKAIFLQLKNKQMHEEKLEKKMSLYSLHLSYPGSSFGNLGYISLSSSVTGSIFVVVQSFSQVRLFATHGLQHTRLPCHAPSAGFARRIAQVLRLDYPTDNPPQGSLDVLAPQTVDEGVQHRGDHSVHH